MRLHLPFLLPALALPLFAEAKLTRTGGVLGQTITFDMQGDPGELWGLALSFNEGPTPLSIFDPADPKVLGVGLDLFPLWKTGGLGGAGLASLTLNVPPTPAFQGLAFYSQMVTFFGVATLTDEVSNRTAFVLGAAQTSTFTAGDHVDEIDLHTATALDDGSVLLSGGTAANLAGLLITLDDYYVFDNQAGAFVLQGQPMTEARTFHSATKLADGRVLTLGGVDANVTNVRKSGEIFDPTTGNVTPVPDMSVARVAHTATLLADGRVFVAGGTSDFDFTNPLGALAAIHASTEIYDPATNLWSPGPSLPLPRGLHSASLLGDGRVLMTGGLEVATVFGVPVGSISNDARRYDPATNQILGTASFNGERGLHDQITLPNGDALIAGGVSGNLILLSFNPVGTSRIYDHVSNTWTNTASLSRPRGFLQLVLAGSKVVAIGGVSTFDIIALSGAPVPEIETTTTSALSWTTTTTTVLPRPQPRSVLMDGGLRILTTGSGDNGSGGAIDDLTADVYIP